MLEKYNWLTLTRSTNIYQNVVYIFNIVKNEISLVAYNTYFLP
jgi:hypothetical protein